MGTKKWSLREHACSYGISYWKPVMFERCLFPPPTLTTNTHWRPTVCQGSHRCRVRNKTGMPPCCFITQAIIKRWMLWKEKHRITVVSACQSPSSWAKTLRSSGVWKDTPRVSVFQGFLWIQFSGQLSQPESAGWGPQVEPVDPGLSLAQDPNHVIAYSLKDAILISWQS